ncbi:hypothetical protein L914_00668 [Phytophthora nicotianae]|uniref:Uncharacterized protein n=1 Tax=Phytophthora nicotianae TaxID=4792 RepID=W2P6B8_PHYNI|nr:hypothetical protein L914_00668 [Phytophthora nicotianae]
MVGQQTTLLSFSDNKVQMLGTARLNLIYDWDRLTVGEAVQLPEESDRGCWELVAAVEPVPEWKQH